MFSFEVILFLLVSTNLTCSHASHEYHTSIWTTKTLKTISTNKLHYTFSYRISAAVLRFIRHRPTLSLCHDRSFPPAAFYSLHVL
uniref:Secreted protein n=1 Tax=Zea mays TaxID=4577 RepID=C4J228_MAIZE|nr:unknown [Zea mays]